MIVTLQDHAFIQAQQFIQQVNDLLSRLHEPNIGPETTAELTRQLTSMFSNHPLNTKELTPDEKIDNLFYLINELTTQQVAEYFKQASLVFLPTLPHDKSFEKAYTTFLQQYKDTLMTMHTWINKRRLHNETCLETMQALTLEAFHLSNDQHPDSDNDEDGFIKTIANLTNLFNHAIVALEEKAIKDIEQIVLPTSKTRELAANAALLLAQYQKLDPDKTDKKHTAIAHGYSELEKRLLWEETRFQQHKRGSNLYKKAGDKLMKLPEQSISECYVVTEQQSPIKRLADLRTYEDELFLELGDNILLQMVINLSKELATYQSQEPGMMAVSARRFGIFAADEKAFSSEQRQSPDHRPKKT